MTEQVSVRGADLAPIRAAMQRLPRSAAGRARRPAVDKVVDLARGSGGLPPTDVLVFRLAGGHRVIMRPSGTEPKLKSYYEVVIAVDPEDGPDSARIYAAARLDALGRDIEGALGL